MQRTRRSKLVRAASGGRRAGRPYLPHVEKLEDRTLLTVSSTWDATHGILSVVTDANDAIAVTASAGNVKVNGSDPSGPVLAAAVQRLNVTDTAPGGPGGSSFDLSAVLHATFPALARIQVTGGGGSNTLIGPNLSLTWDVSGADSGDVQGMTAPLFFTSVGNLDGGTGTDDFAFHDGGSLSGRIAGGGGSETLDFSACNNPVAVTLTGSGSGRFRGTAAGYLGGGFTGIGTLVGGNGSSTLTGEDLSGPAASTWTLASAGTYSDGSATLNFSGFATLKGGTGLNTFDLLTDSHNLGLVTADLYGGPNANTFSFQAGTDLQGSVFGGGGRNTIDDTLFGSGLGVQLTGYDTTGYAGTQFDTVFHNVNIVNVPAGTGSNLTGDPTLGTWSLAAGTYSDGNPALTFSGFSSLQGGSGADTLNLTGGATLTGSGATGFSGSTTGGDSFSGMDTLAGTGTLTGENVASTWRLGATRTYSDGSHTLTISGFSTWQGGSAADTFVFIPGATLTGSIDGGPGHDTLNYSAYTTPVNVNLAAGTATAVSGSVTNVENAIGPSTHGNVLIGDETDTVVLGSTTPRTNDLLTATATATDPDGESVTLTYVWSVNGKVVKTTAGTPALTDALNLALPGNGNKGDTITVTVTPFDGDLYGAIATTAPAVVADSPPVVTSVGITPANPVPGQLLTAAVAAHDDDGDRISYAYQWLRNGTPIVGATAATLDLSQHGYGVVGDVIAVRVTPTAAAVNGASFTESASLVASPGATFVIGTDHLIYELKLDGLGTPTGGYILVSSVLARSVAVGQDALGRTELFVLGMDDQVWAFHLDGNGHSLGDGFLTAPGQVKAISVTRTALGNPEVFVIGTDNQVRGNVLNAAGSAGSGYFLTTAGQVKGVSATQDASGNPLVFVIGTDNQVHAEDLGPTGRTSGGYFLVATGTVQAIKAGLDASGNPLLLAIKADGQVWGHTLDGTGHGTGSWYLTRPGQAQSLNWCVTAAGNIDLFVLGTDHRVWWQKLDGSGQSLGGYALAAAGVVNDVANDGNLTALTPGLVDLLFALSPPDPATPRQGRRSGP